MQKHLIAATVFVLVSSPALTEQTKTETKAFDLCVSTFLDLESYKTTLIAMGAEELPTNSANAISPDVVSAHLFMLDGEPFISAFGVKEINGRKSRNCTIFYNELAFENANTLLVDGYDAAQVEKTRQGSCDIALYRIDLRGFVEKTFASIQSCQGVTSIGLFSEAL
jgi:hypothetical protein